MEFSERRAETGPVFVVVRDTGPEAEDALALADRLAEVQAAALVIAPILAPVKPLTTAAGKARRLQVAQTRVWAAGRLSRERDFEVVPVVGPSPGRELHTLARERDAQLLVLPSERHSQSGRVQLGRWYASTVVHDAPCAVAIAPNGYRGRSRAEALRVGVAYDGQPESLASLRSAHALASAATGTLRVIVAMTGEDDVEIAETVTSLGGGAAVELVARPGHPLAVLTRASGDLDLLVCGSRGRRPLRRLALGRIPIALMRSAMCPVVVVLPAVQVPAAPRLSA